VLSDVFSKYVDWVVVVILVKAETGDHGSGKISAHQTFL
jgi:hypothetical protein